MRKITAVSVALALLMTALVAYVYRASLYDTLDSFSLIPHSEHFTELYFVNPQSLPKKIAAGDIVSFTFAVHNLEEQDIVYTYRVYVKSPDGETQLGSGTVFAKSGAIESVDGTYTFKTAPKSGSVVVELPAQNQHIDFIFTSR